MKKKNGKSHFYLRDSGNVCLTPERSGEDMRRMAMNPEGGPIRGHGLPLSALNGVGYPDSVLTITTRKAGSAFPRPSRTLRAGKK